MPLFIPITKVDAARQLVYGTLSEEVPDKTGEILDYASVKPAFMEWSDQFRQASGGKSLGNVRAMHGSLAVGKLTDMHFDDAARRISGVAKIVDDDEWRKVMEGVYTGFSIGGGYARRWPDAQNPELMRYTPTLSEVSLVDNPAVPTATFEIIKQDGTRELRKFSFARKLSLHDNPSPDEDSMTNDTAPDDGYEARIDRMLKDLAWLAGEAKDDGDDEMLVCIQELQDCLMQGEEDQDDDTDSVSRTRSRKAVYSEVRNEILSLQKRIAQLEAQPVPARGVLRVIGKPDDRETAAAAMEKLAPADRARELMKIALSHPVEV